MSDQGFDELVRVTHIVQNHHEIVLGCSQEIGAEHDCESFGRHMVVLLKVGDPTIT